MGDQEPDIGKILLKRGGKTKEVDPQLLRAPHHVRPVRHMDNITSQQASEHPLLQTGNHRPTVDTRAVDSAPNSEANSNQKD